MGSSPSSCQIRDSILNKKFEKRSDFLAASMPMLKMTRLMVEAEAGEAAGRPEVEVGRSG
jgi:hypothetical protein